MNDNLPRMSSFDLENNDKTSAVPIGYRNIYISISLLAYTLICVDVVNSPGSNVVITIAIPSNFSIISDIFIRFVTWKPNEFNLFLYHGYIISYRY